VGVAGDDRSSQEIQESANWVGRANVLTLAQKYTRKEDLREIVETFLATDFEGGRHIPRVEKIKAAESC
jgi:ribose 5-phosphate isomerase B